MGRIESMHGIPAIAAVADVSRNSFFTREVDEDWNEAVIAVTVNRG